ncbi:MAG: tetratricopeptide repeat protein [Pyrinomonadaceae bacterium]
MSAFLSLTLLLFSLFSCGGATNSSPEIAGGSAPTLLADAAQTASSDDALVAVRRLDQSGIGPGDQLPQLPPAEHLRRASVYLTNRAFDDARRHWQALIARYPQDPAVSASLFSMGRSYFQERKYQEALGVFEQLGKRETQSKEGRDGFYYVAPTLLRLNRPLEAAVRYREYIERFPQGERIADAHLNVIDSLREGGDNQNAIVWVERTRERFQGTPTATNALFARLRLDIATQDFAHAAATAPSFNKPPSPAAPRRMPQRSPTCGLTVWRKLAANKKRRPLISPFPTAPLLTTAD